MTRAGPATTDDTADTLACASLSLLGPPRLLVRGVAVAPGSRKAIALLAILALEGRCTRSKLAVLFWPELDGASARRNLRRELHRLRGAGAQSAWHDDGDALELAPGVQLDVAQFEQALDAGDLATALACYRGVLLDGFDLGDPGAFEIRAAVHRERLAQRHRGALQAQVALHEAAGRWREALACQLRLVDGELPQESHFRDAMRLHALLGEREAAMQLYERCRRLLGRELGLRPMPETLALVESVRRGELAPAPPVPAPAAAAAPAAAGFDAPLPFTGRQDAMAAVLGALEDGRTAWLLGEPGIGKSRLALEAAARRGAHVLVSARAGDALLPYATLARLLRARLGAAMLAGLPAWVQRDLAHLLPELGPALGPLQGEADRQRLHAAASAALRLHWPAGVRTVIFDDWHAADAATLAWWRQAGDEGEVFGSHGAAAGTRIVTARYGELSETLRESLEAGQAQERDQRFDLAPLGADAVAALLEAPAGDAGGWLVTRLHRASGGNPFYLHETLRHLNRIGWLQRGASGTWLARPDAASQALPLPPRVSEAVHARLAALDDATRRLLEAASLAGGAFHATNLDGATALTDFEQVAALERAVAAGVLVHDNSAALRFTHDLLPQVLAERLSPERRRLLHRRLAAALERHGGAPARIAAHLESAGAPGAALRWRLASAAAAEAMAAHDQALDAYDAALADSPSPEHAARIRPRRAAVLQRCGRAALADAEFGLAEEQALCAGDGDGALAAQLAQAEHWGCTNRVDDALQRVQALLDDGVLSRTQQVLAMEIRADGLLRRGDTADALATLDEALQRLPTGPSALRGKLLLSAGRTRFFRGDLDGAVRCLGRAARVYSAVGALEPLAKATYMQGAVEMNRGDNDTALTLLERGRALAERAGSVPVQRGAILNQVKILTQTGRVAEAQAALAAGEALAPVYENATIEAAFVQARYYCHALRGEIDAARECIATVLATGDACVDLYWRVGARQLVIDLLLLCGELDRAETLLDEARALCADDADGHHLPLVLAKQAWLALLRGDAALALQRVDAAKAAAGTLLPEAADVARHVEAAARLQLVDAAGSLALLPDPGAACTEESKALQWAVRLQAELAQGGALPASLDAVRALLAEPSRLPALEAGVLRRAWQDACGAPVGRLANGG